MVSFNMTLLSLLTATDLQKNLADTIRAKRKQAKFSRQALAERSTVAASTIKKFETTGQISLRQFLLLWQTLDSLDRVNELTKIQPKVPRSIEEVLTL